MTKRDFFILIIKVFGLYSLVTALFSSLPNNVSFALFGEVETLAVIWIIAAIVVVIGLFVLLVFMAGKVVNLLKLDHGFDDERIEIGNLSASDIVKIGTFVMGGLMIVDNIPPFLSHSLYAFKSSAVGLIYGLEDKFYWGVSGLNLVLGYLLIRNYHYVDKLFNKTKRKH